MKIAIIHDWLVTYAGAERVLEQILHCFPEADLYAVVDFFPEDLRKKHLLGKKAQTTFIQKLPLARKKYYSYLPLMSLAIEQIDLAGYDLIISSSHAIAKGVITGPNQLHISYVHSPMRYAWDLQNQYLKEARLTKGIKSWLAKSMLHKMRIWDLRTVNGVDEFIANSNFIAKRIWKTYRRSAEVIYPPVNIDDFQLNANKDDFYLTVSRLAPYKKVDLIVKAFAKMPDKKLIVIGAGPQMKQIKKAARPNIEIMGHQPTSVIADFMQRAKAFVFAAEEDFGIVPLEAQACGTPVIAFGKGGCLETVNGIYQSKIDFQGLAPIDPSSVEFQLGGKEQATGVYFPYMTVARDEANNAGNHNAKGIKPTGIFFQEQTESSLIAAVEKFTTLNFSPEDCRNNALRFATSRFVEEFRNKVALISEAHQGQKT